MTLCCIGIEYRTSSNLTTLSVYIHTPRRTIQNEECFVLRTLETDMLEMKESDGIENHVQTQYAAYKEGVYVC